jgi:cardiolipin synthase
METLMSRHEHFGPRPRRVIWTVPNFISFLRIASIPFIAWLVANHFLIQSLIVMAISGASDGLDGFIARRFNQVSLLGQLLDPIADRLLIICSALSLGIAGIVPWWLLIFICMRDVVLALQILILSQHGYGPLPVHFVGKVGTAMLLISIPVLIISDLVRNWFFYFAHCTGLALVWWGLGLYWLAAIIYLRQGYKLLKENNEKKADQDEVISSTDSTEKNEVVNE